MNKRRVGCDGILFEFIFLIYYILRRREWWQRRNVNGLPEGIHCLCCWEECSPVRLLQVEVRPHLSVFLQRRSLLRWTEHAAAQQVTSCDVMSCHAMSCYVMLCHISSCRIVMENAYHTSHQKKTFAAMRLEPLSS